MVSRCSIELKGQQHNKRFWLVALVVNLLSPRVQWSTFPATKAHLHGGLEGHIAAMEEREGGDLRQGSGSAAALGKTALVRGWGRIIAIDCDRSGGAKISV